MYKNEILNTQNANINENLWLQQYSQHLKRDLFLLLMQRTFIVPDAIIIKHTYIKHNNNFYKDDAFFLTKKNTIKSITIALTCENWNIFKKIQIC